MKVVLIVAWALMTTSASYAGKRSDPESWGWYCEVTDNGNVKFTRAKGIGTPRKRDATCE